MPGTSSVTNNLLHKQQFPWMLKDGTKEVQGPAHQSWRSGQQHHDKAGLLTENWVSFSTTLKGFLKRENKNRGRSWKQKGLQK